MDSNNSFYTEREIEGMHKDFEDLIQKPHFIKAMRELNQNSKIKRKHLLTLIDFSKPSIEKRLYVLDLKNKKILFNTWVSHGDKSGLLYAESFSNIPDSHQSSLGFVLSGELFYGKHGLSLKLDGLEKGINHNIRSRDIVMHSAQYATQEFIEENGYLGRSHGCPAIPPDQSDQIFTSIAYQSLIYVIGNSN